MSTRTPRDHDELDEVLGFDEYGPEEVLGLQVQLLVDEVRRLDEVLGHMVERARYYKEPPTLEKVERLHRATQKILKHYF